MTHTGEWTCTVTNNQGFDYANQSLTVYCKSYSHTKRVAQRLCFSQGYCLNFLHNSAYLWWLGGWPGVLGMGSWIGFLGLGFLIDGVLGLWCESICFFGVGALYIYRY